MAKNWDEIIFQMKLQMAGDEKNPPPDDETMRSIAVLAAKKFLCESHLCRMETPDIVKCNWKEYHVDPVGEFQKVTCVVYFTGCGERDGWEVLTPGKHYYEGDCSVILKCAPTNDIKPWGIIMEYSTIPEMDGCAPPDCLCEFKWQQGVVAQGLMIAHSMNARWATQGKLAKAEEMYDDICAQAIKDKGKYGGYPVCRSEFDTGVHDFMSM